MRKGWEKLDAGQASENISRARKASGREGGRDWDAGPAAGGEEEVTFGICQSVNEFSQVHIGLWFYSSIWYDLLSTFQGLLTVYDPLSVLFWFWSMAMYKFILNMFSDISGRLGVAGEGSSQCSLYHLETLFITEWEEIGSVFPLLPPSSHSVCWAEVKSVSWSKAERRTRKWAGGCGIEEKLVQRQKPGMTSHHMRIWCWCFWCI